MNVNSIKIFQKTISGIKSVFSAFKRIKPLKADSFEISMPENIVPVYNFLFKNIRHPEKIVSRGFAGCHGAGVFQDGKMFFAHFPPFMSGKIENALEKSLKNFQKGAQTSVVFISPVSKSGKPSGKFDDYLEIIKRHLGADIDVKTLSYPRKSGTYTYTSIINGTASVHLLKKEG